MWSTPSSDTSSREPSHVNHDRPAAPPTGHPYVLRENRSLWCFGVGLSVSLTVWGDYFICCPLVEIHVFLGKTGLCGDKHFFFNLVLVLSASHVSHWLCEGTLLPAALRAMRSSYEDMRPERSVSKDRNNIWKTTAQRPPLLHTIISMETDRQHRA